MQTISAELENGGTLLTQGASTPPGRWTSHPWAALALRALGITLLMGGLAAIGAMSILSGTAQGKILDDGQAARADVAAAWLAVSRSNRLPARQPATTHAPPTPSTSASAPPGDPEPLSAGITKDGKVVLNCASAEELTRLPGVGEKRSADIVALRERLGKFKRPTDLLRVRGIGPKSLQKMKPYFVLDPPDDSGAKDKRERRAAKSEQAAN